MDLELVKQADFVLSKCGRPQVPTGITAFDMGQGLLYVVTTPATSITTGTRIIPPDVPNPGERDVRPVYVVRGFSANMDHDCYIRILFPDGTFFEQIPSALSGDLWFGSYRRTFSRDIVCPVGSVITIITDTTRSVTGSSNASTVGILFEGAFRYMLKGGPNAQRGVRPASELARYSRSPNGNILAPEWMLDLDFAEIPQGAVQTPYTYDSGTLQNGTGTLTAAGYQTIQIPVDSGWDFRARRFRFETTFTNTLAGQLMVKARDGSGYAMYSDYAPLSQVQGAPYAADWCVRGGKSMLFDFQFRNVTGTGTLTFTVIVDGARQRRANV
jgi:hypothetical protein